MSNAAKTFNILTINLNVLHNYFDNSIKLFLDLYLKSIAKFLDTSAKPFCGVRSKCKPSVIPKICTPTNFHIITVIEKK